MQAARNLMHLSVVVTLLSALTTTAKEVMLTGLQIRAAISGKYVIDEHRWVHRYFAFREVPTLMRLAAAPRP